MKRYLVSHGDMFDGISSLAPWLSVLGGELPRPKGRGFRFHQ